MNTRVLMAASSFMLALAGLLTLFIPDKLLGLLGVPATDPLPALVQLMGSLFFAFAMVNWTAKDSRIGGVYARPISVGNFTHFLVGAVVLANHEFSNGINPLLFIVMIVYAVFAILFWWLTFRSSGIAKGHPASSQ
jgi:hypothetical protein